MVKATRGLHGARTPSPQAAARLLLMAGAAKSSPPGRAHRGKDPASAAGTAPACSVVGWGACLRRKHKHGARPADQCQAAKDGPGRHELAAVAAAKAFGKAYKDKFPKAAAKISDDLDQLRAPGLAMAFKLIQAAQDRRRAVNAPHLVALVRAGARFERGVLAERPEAAAA